MTSPEVRAQIINGRPTVVVPFGAVEQHGPHLPLATDAILGDHLGAMIAERLNGFCARPPSPSVALNTMLHFRGHFDSARNA
jgi:creatinine amidohydrolase/Fe(II)-dependent formamide hydrolase-like protein